ncbi:MAG: hypothetical protein EOP06_08055 [Proteobacteria bacterium]|nr:MAG: hypothetical protein EOP06_08055 [Pseudomonadota bacterium]
MSRHFITLLMFGFITSPALASTFTIGATTNFMDCSQSNGEGPCDTQMAGPVGMTTELTSSADYPGAEEGILKVEGEQSTYKIKILQTVDGTTVLSISQVIKATSAVSFAGEIAYTKNNEPTGPITIAGAALGANHFESLLLNLKIAKKKTKHSGGARIPESAPGSLIHN